MCAEFRFTPRFHPRKTGRRADTMGLMGRRLSLSVGLLTLFVACSTFSGETTEDAGDASVADQDGAAIDGGKVDGPANDGATVDGATVDVCMGTCESLCDPVLETGTSYRVTALSASTPMMTGDFAIFPPTSTAVDVLDDDVPDEEATKLTCLVKAPQQLVFAHEGPVPNGQPITRVIARARIRRNTLIEKSGTGFQLGLVKGGNPNTAPKALGPWRTVGSTTFVVQSVSFTSVPGTGTPFTGNDVDGVTILLGFHLDSMNSIHVTKAWIEVCRTR